MRGYSTRPLANPAPAKRGGERGGLCALGQLLRELDLDGELL
jgi:hypothetical protein